MNRDPKDALDQAIDEVLASMAAGEPRRVDATSVRKAIGERRAPRIPLWFAAAAILLISFGAWIKGRSVTPPAQVSVARSATGQEPVKVQPSPVPEGLEGASTVRLASSRSKPSAINDRAEPLYEGLPRIVIVAIEQPDLLTAPALEADALLIPPIEISALSVPTLSNRPDQHQEKPQS